MFSPEDFIARPVGGLGFKAGIQPDTLPSRLRAELSVSPHRNAECPQAPQRQGKDTLVSG